MPRCWRPQVRRAVAGLDLPNNPLDQLIDMLGGPPAVAEMTGRKGRLVRIRNGEAGVKVRRDGLVPPPSTHERGHML